MAHPAEIDEEAINRVFDEFAGSGSPGEPLEGEHIPAGEAEGEGAAAWLPITRTAVSAFANHVAPNWEVGLAEREEWATAAADVMQQLMPGGMGNIEKWGPWGQFAFACAGVALCGFDMEKFRFKPLRQAPADDNTTEPPADGPRKPFTTVS